MLIPLTELIHRYGVQPGPVLHIGAHLAEEAAAYETHGFTPVVWVEANPSLIPRLLSRVREYEGHRVVQALCLDDVREVTFHVANNGQSSSVLELGTHKQAHPEVEYVDSHTIRSTTVDRMAEQGTIDQATFLNLDVQGAELLVLKGARAYLAGVDVIYSEVNVAELYEGCALLPEMDDWLAKAGFGRVATKMTDKGWGDAIWTRAG